MKIILDNVLSSENGLFFLPSLTLTCLGFAGTPGYLSPEVLRKEAYGKPVDIWACGKSSLPSLLLGSYVLSSVTKLHNKRTTYKSSRAHVINLENWWRRGLVY